MVRAFFSGVVQRNFPRIQMERRLYGKHFRLSVRISLSCSANHLHHARLRPLPSIQNFISHVQPFFSQQPSRCPFHLTQRVLRTYFHFSPSLAISFFLPFAPLVPQGKVARLRPRRRSVRLPFPPLAHGRHLTSKIWIVPFPPPIPLYATFITGPIPL